MFARSHSTTKKDSPLADATNRAPTGEEKPAAPAQSNVNSTANQGGNAHGDGVSGDENAHRASRSRKTCALEPASPPRSDGATPRQQWWIPRYAINFTSAAQVASSLVLTNSCA